MRREPLAKVLASKLFSIIGMKHDSKTWFQCEPGKIQDEAFIGFSFTSLIGVKELKHGIGTI